MSARKGMVDAEYLLAARNAIAAFFTKNRMS